MSQESSTALVLPLVFSLLLLQLNVSAAQDLPQQELPPAEATENTAGEEFGYGVGSVFASALYTPLKVGYVGLGLITGGFGYVVSGGREDVADNIIHPAIRGDYIITPKHLKGVKPIVFVGPSDPSQPPPLSGRTTAKPATITTVPLPPSPGLEPDPTGW